MVNYFNTFGCILTGAIVLLILVYGRQYQASGYYEQIMLNNSTVAPVIDRSHHNQALVY